MAADHADPPRPTVMSLTAPLSISRSLWSDKGHDGVLADATVFIDPHRQHLDRPSALAHPV